MKNLTKQSARILQQGALSAPFVLAMGLFSAVSVANQAVPVGELDQGQPIKAYTPAANTESVRQAGQRPKVSPGFPSSPDSRTGAVRPVDLLYQLETLQQEVQQLRGIVEQQAHDLQRMREEQRDRYLDLDRRVSQLGKQGASNGGQAADQPGTAPAIGTAPSSVEKVTYQKALDLVRSKQYEQGIEAFNQYLSQFPQGDYVGNSFYFLGEVQLLKGNKEEALKAFGALLNRDPTHRKAPEAKLKLGKIYAALGDKAKARAMWQEVIRDYPKSSQARLADIQLKKK